ncbi:hypothetical protein L7F22_059361 [Adiantum nelumboides]|nr:hypothetical protein [Adiantum nelumboides]
MVAARINFQQGAKRNLKPMEAKDKQEYKEKNSSQNSSKGNSNNDKPKENGVFKGKNKLPPEELERYRKENKCFKCGEQGHSYRSCIQRNTRNEQPRASIVEAPKEEVHCKGSPLSYAWGKVREHDAFIDPGSTHNFISLELAAKVGVQDFEMRDAMKADGAFISQDVSVIPLIGKLRLHIQGYVDKEDFFISFLKHEDVILGAPWFDRLAASIKFPERKISFKFKEKDMYINAQESGSIIPLKRDAQSCNLNVLPIVDAPFAISESVFDDGEMVHAEMMHEMDAMDDALIAHVLTTHDTGISALGLASLASIASMPLVGVSNMPPPTIKRGRPPKKKIVEGVLLRAAEEIGALQEERKKADPSQAEALDRFLVKLRSYAAGESSFTFVVSDPSGNSFIENPYAPGSDPLLSVKFYDRSSAEQAALGFLIDQSLEGPSVNSSKPEERTSKETHKYVPAGTQKVPHGAVGAPLAHRAIAQGNSADVTSSLLKYSAPEEVMTFPSTCGACAAYCETRMYVTNIPYFKEVIVMASTCDTCGYRNSELKSGGSIPLKGKKISVKVLSHKDLSRDVIKSDTSLVTIPELELELASGTLGGLVTTVEGLLQQISARLFLRDFFSPLLSMPRMDVFKFRDVNLKIL